MTIYIRRNLKKRPAAVKQRGHFHHLFELFPPDIAGVQHFVGLVAAVATEEFLVNRLDHRVVVGFAQRHAGRPGHTALWRAWP